MSQKKTAQVAQEPTTQPVEPKRFAVGDKEFMVDRFKSDFQKAIKNRGWSSFQQRYEELTHRHSHDSHNPDGTVNNQCTERLGHFHEVEQYVAEDGTIKLRCGPPKKWTKVRTNKGMEKRAVEIQYAHNGYYDRKNEPVVTEWKTDTHTHEFEYYGSYTVSVNLLKKLNNQDKEALKQEGVTFQASDLKVNQGPSMTQANINA